MIPAATQASALTSATASMIAIAGMGSLLTPGVRPWYERALLATPFRQFLIMSAIEKVSSVDWSRKRGQVKAVTIK